MLRLEDARRLLNPFGYLRLPGGDALHRALQLADAGHAAKALAAIEAVVEHQPDLAAAHLFLGLAFDEAGRHADAREAFGRALAMALDGFDELCLIGAALLDRDQPERSAAAYRQAIAQAPNAGRGYWGLGRALSRLGDGAGARANLEKATLLQPNFAPAHADLGHQYRAANLNDAALASYRRALELDPGDERTRCMLHAVIAVMVPPWHFARVNDARRNRAFRRAIERAVTPRSFVLDLGAGSGLLAMMAARAGARHVTACEPVAPLAETAERIVAANGYSGRIDIVARRSTEIEIGRDMARRANLLVAEIFDAGLLSEGALDSLDHARAELLTRRARIIPAGATVFAMLIESREIAAGHRAARAAGFDLGALNALAPRLYARIDLNRYAWRRLCRRTAVLDFDFAAGRAPPAATRIPVRVTASGTCHAIAFWFRLRLDARTAIATGPDDAPSHWKQAVYTLETPARLAAGRTVTLRARHDRNVILLDLEPLRPGDR